jgi:hypothetical protein
VGKNLEIASKEEVSIEKERPSRYGVFIKKDFVCLWLASLSVAGQILAQF